MTRHTRSAAHRLAPRYDAPKPLPSRRFFATGDMISVPKAEYHMIIILMALAVVVSITCVLTVWLYAIPTAEHALEITRGL